MKKNQIEEERKGDEQACQDKELKQHVAIHLQTNIAPPDQEDAQQRVA